MFSRRPPSCAAALARPARAVLSGLFGRVGGVVSPVTLVVLLSRPLGRPSVNTHQRAFARVCVSFIIAAPNKRRRVRRTGDSSPRYFLLGGCHTCALGRRRRASTLSALQLRQSAATGKPLATPSQAASDAAARSLFPLRPTRPAGVCRRPSVPSSSVHL